MPPATAVTPTVVLSPPLVSLASFDRASSIGNTVAGIAETKPSSLLQSYTFLLLSECPFVSTIKWKIKNIAAYASCTLVQCVLGYIGKHSYQLCSYMSHRSRIGCWIVSAHTRQYLKQRFFWRIAKYVTLVKFEHLLKYQLAKVSDVYNNFASI